MVQDRSTRIITPDTTTSREVPARSLELWLITNIKGEVQLGSRSTIIGAMVGTAEEEPATQRENRVCLITSQLSCNLQVGQTDVTYVSIPEKTGASSQSGTGIAGRTNESIVADLLC